jgi:hypothetical protein
MLDRKLNEHQDKALKQKIKNILDYIDKEKKYDFTNEDFKNSISIISILNYNLFEDINKNPINIFFRESIILINKLEELDKLEKQNIN